MNTSNTVQKIKVMSKMSKIDQIHLRAVMLCMSKMHSIEYCTKDQSNVEDVKDIKTSHNRFP